jgi:hypothetical protein
LKSLIALPRPILARSSSLMLGRRQPSENELKIARFQGTHVARVAKKQSS